MRILREIAQELSDIGIVEQKPDLEGRNMSMVIAPNRSAVKKPKPMTSITTQPEIDDVTAIMDDSLDVDIDDDAVEIEE